MLFLELVQFAGLSGMAARRDHPVAALQVNARQRQADAPVRAGNQDDQLFGHCPYPIGGGAPCQWRPLQRKAAIVRYAVDGSLPATAAASAFAGVRGAVALSAVAGSHRRSLLLARVVRPRPIRCRAGMLFGLLCAAISAGQGSTGPGSALPRDSARVSLAAHRQPGGQAAEMA